MIIRKVVISLMIVSLLVGCGIAQCAEKERKSAKILELYHYWTAGGEKEAIDALINYFNEKYPETLVIQSPTAGGGGATLKTVIKTLVAAREAPDGCEILNGYEFIIYAKDGALEPLDDFWEEKGLVDQIPEPIALSVMYNGKHYGVPLDIHTHNNVFYNKEAFDTLGLKIPTTWDEFWEVCDAIREKAPGVDPIALGDRNKFPAAINFGSILLGTDPQAYQDFINGKITADQLRPALQRFKKFMGYVNSDHAALTWDEEVGRVYSGKAAMCIMGDFAKGYFMAMGWEYGKQYGAFKPIGTEDAMVYCCDVFQLFKGCKHPEEALKWLDVCASVEGQQRFNPIKGSIPTRMDTPVTAPTYDKFSIERAYDLEHASILAPSLQWSGTPEEISNKFMDKISEFTTTLDVDGTAEYLASEVARARAAEKFYMTWNIFR